MNNKLILGSVKGRHEMPASEYLYDGEVTDFSMEAIQNHVNSRLEELVTVHNGYGAPALNLTDYTDVTGHWCEEDIILYVTGLTAVTTAAIAWCIKNGCRITLMHFDRDSASYVEQVII